MERVTGTEEGGGCFFVTHATSGEVRAPEQGGGICSLGRPLELDAPMVVNVGVGKRPLRPYGAASWVPPQFHGRVDPKLGAVRVEVQWTGGSKELAFANGYFLGAVEALYEVPAELLPVHVVAYDPAGREVQRRQISAESLRLE